MVTRLSDTEGMTHSRRPSESWTPFHPAVAWIGLWRPELIRQAQRQEPVDPSLRWDDAVWIVSWAFGVPRGSCKGAGSRHAPGRREVIRLLDASGMPQQPSSQRKLGPSLILRLPGLAYGGQGSSGRRNGKSQWIPGRGGITGSGVLHAGSTGAASGGDKGHDGP